jgi:cytochrome c biogenesis protein CcmG, thiol:disulfide interchange protein DsbE
MPSYRQGEDSIVGKTAKDFSVEISGKPRHLSDYKGTIVVLNFWATWCPPCVEETPALNRLHKYLASRNGVILGIAADEDTAAYDRFLRDQGVIFPTYRDPATKDNHSPIAQTYGTSMYPETYVIDRNGKIARKFIGFQQWDSPEMLAYFDALLGQT